MSATTTPLVHEPVLFYSLSWPSISGWAKQVQSILALTLARTVTQSTLVSTRNIPVVGANRSARIPMSAELRSNKPWWGFRWDLNALVKQQRKHSDTIHPRAQGKCCRVSSCCKIATGGTNNNEKKGALSHRSSCTTLHTWVCACGTRDNYALYAWGQRTVPVARWANRRDVPSAFRSTIPGRNPPPKMSAIE